jgi:hypothetical protein
MQALTDFQDLRAKLRNALIARDTMRNASLPQPRRDLGTQAYTRLVDQIIDLLERLEFTQVIPGGEAKPTNAVLEEVLAGIARAEAAMGHGAASLQSAE